MKRKKQDSLKIVVFPRKNNDFQGSVPRWKHCVCLLIRVFLFKKKRCKNNEKIEFFNEKSNPKPRWLQNRQKTPPDTLPETTFWPKTAFFLRFWGPGCDFCWQSWNFGASQGLGVFWGHRFGASRGCLGARTTMSEQKFMEILFFHGENWHDFGSVMKKHGFSSTKSIPTNMQ